MAKKKVITKIEPSYELSKTLEKVIKQMIIVALVAIGVYLADEGIPELMLEYPQYSVILTFAIAAIAGFLNWWKHKNDTKEVEI